MKQKLLITLGCSWTEGAGTKNPHELGWPKQLGKRLGFDKVINFGKGGDSNSGQAKLFYDFIHDGNAFNEYDVLVMFLMTSPYRFSFYIDGGIKGYTIANGTPVSIEREYLNELKNLEIDTTLEQVFFIRSVENLCKSYNFDFIITTWVENFMPFFHLYKNTNTNLFSVPKNIAPPKDKNLTYYSPCKHPNELGYELMINEMINGIKENHPKWYSEIQTSNIKYEWKGNYRYKLQWKYRKQIL